MNKHKVLVTGAGGRMGQLVCEAVEKAEDLQLSIKLDRNMQVRRFDEVNPDEVDILIDFTVADFFSEVLTWAESHNKAIVSGTTGLSAEHRQKLARLAQKVPVLWAPNMSLGVAVIKQMLQSFAGLQGFDFQIEEFHHKRKIDRPSGTAISLQESLIEAVGENVPEPVSIRGGGIFGVHRIWAMSEDEVISLEHEALNRSVFATGAVRAASWLTRQGPGLYKIEDLLLNE